MIAVLAISLLFLVALGLVAVIVYERREHARQLNALADRIQAPEAAAYTALAAAAPPIDTSPPPDAFTDPVTPSDDLRLDDMLMEDSVA